jgi:hypothetical protein
LGFTGAPVMASLGVLVSAKRPRPAVSPGQFSVVCRNSRTV